MNFPSLAHDSSSHYGDELNFFTSECIADPVSLNKSPYLKKNKIRSCTNSHSGPSLWTFSVELKYLMQCWREMIDYREKNLWERTKSNHCRLNVHVTKGLVIKPKPQQRKASSLQYHPRSELYCAKDPSRSSSKDKKEKAHTPKRVHLYWSWKNSCRMSTFRGSNW